jgi:argininosuccinate lyase
MEEWKSLHPAFEEDIYEAITPQRVVSARNSYGGTGFDQVRQAIQRAQQILGDD